MDKYVLKSDPAVNTKSELFNREKYVETGDLSFLPCKDGEKLTVYTLERPTVENFDFAMSQPTPTRQNLELVAFCLKSIESAKGLQTFRSKRVPDVGDRILAEELAKIWTWPLFTELAARCIYLASLPPLS
jgi:hypothetical protein